MDPDTDHLEPAPAPRDNAHGRAVRQALVLALAAAALGLWRTSERGLFTAHEARAARVARAMLHAAAWPADKPDPRLVPQFSAEAPDALNYQKPPLYYWAAALASWPGGEVTRLTTRLPSALSFVAMVLATWALGRAIAGERAGLIAALVLLSTPKVLWWSRAAVLDPMLVACITGAMLFFYRAESGKGRPWEAYLFWGLAGLGTLVKATSLVIPLLAAGAYLALGLRDGTLRARLRRVRPLAGMAVLVGMAAPWHLIAHVLTGGAFSRVYWGLHVFGRATGTGVFEKTTSWWYYIPAVCRDLFPWVVFLPGALVQVFRRSSRPVRRGLLLAFAWYVGSFVFFSAVSFRKDEYLFVAYPAAAVLIGHFLDHYVAAHERDRALRPWVVVAMATVAVVTVLLGAALGGLAAWPGAQAWLASAQGLNETDRAVFGALAEDLGASAWLMVLLTAPMAVGGAAALAAVVRSRPGRAVPLLVTTTLLAYLVFIVGVVPTLDRMRSLAPLAARTRTWRAAHAPEAGVLLAVAECHELAFELGDLVTLQEHLETGPRQFLAARLAAGETWLVLEDARALRRGAWGGAIRLEPVLATPQGHRRPMVLAVPEAAGDAAGETQ